MTTILTKTSSTGKAIEISYNGKNTSVTLDGQSLAAAGSWIRILKLDESRGDITHYTAGTTPAVGLTTAEAATIKAAIAGYRANDPRTQRAAITSRMQSALDQMDYHRNRQDGGTGQRFDDVKKYESDYNQAMADLKSFDAAHPELTAALEAEAEKHNAELIAASYRQ